jgi:hypothetical protein
LKNCLEKHEGCIIKAESEQEEDNLLHDKKKIAKQKELESLKEISTTMLNSNIDVLCKPMTKESFKAFKEVIVTTKNLSIMLKDENEACKYCNIFFEFEKDVLEKIEEQSAEFQKEC